jgi:hypothetical protein
MATAMVRLTTDQAADRVRQILAETPDSTFDDVVDRLNRAGIREAMVKAAIWQLYDEGCIEMTQDWKLRLRAVAAD